MSAKRIYFDYEQTESLQKSKSISTADITRINLFIFDANGLFVSEYIDEAPQIGPGYFMTIDDLKAGYYRFVAWGNLNEQYAFSPALIPGETAFDDLRVFLKSIQNNVVEEQLEPLFFATHKGSNTIEILAMTTQNIRLNLENNLYKVNVTVAGMDSASVADNDYRIDISDNNGAYTFDNDFAPCAPFTYTQTCIVDQERNNDLKASLKVLRLAANRNPMLRLVNKQTNHIIIEDNLVGLISEINEAGAAIDFAKTHEFDIRYELDQLSSMHIIIYINGWKLVRQIQILD
jgi:hypothetical protein